MVGGGRDGSEVKSDDGGPRVCRVEMMKRKGKEKDAAAKRHWL